AVLFVIVSISPVPKLLPGPVSYFQSAVLTPVFAAPVKSSLHVSVNPDGGAGTPVGAVAARGGALLELASGFTIRAASEQPATPSANSTRRRFMGPPSKLKSTAYHHSKMQLMFSLPMLGQTLNIKDQPVLRSP